MDESGEPYQLFLTIIHHPISPEVGVGFFIMLILLLCSALVSGSEIAYFSMSSADLAQLKDSKELRDKKVFALLEKPKKLLATILIANNFINVAIVILSSLLIDYTLNFNNFPILGFVFEVVFITFLILLIGEIVPKVYANQNPKSLMYLMVTPLSILQKVFTPLSFLLTSFTNIIDKKIVKKTESISVDQLSYALDLAKDETVDEDDHKILKGIVKFGNTSVKQIMTSRVDVIALDKTLSFKEVQEIVLDSGYSRLPVYENNFDNIVGVIYVKDLLPNLENGNNFNWQKLTRPAFFVPENKKIDDLLKEFQAKKIHMAVVVDEYGGSSGLVSLEDIIEEIVGDISDEFDDEDLIYTKIDEKNYVFQGKILLNDFYRVLEIEGTEFEENKGDADTLAGFILEIHGKIPKKNERILFKNFQFKIETADNRRITSLKLTILPKENPNQQKFEE